MPEMVGRSITNGQKFDCWGFSVDRAVDRSQHPESKVIDGKIST